MHIHILGICGTFMAGLATIAKQKGYRVSGSDKNFYPPMSDILKGHQLTELYSFEDFTRITPPDLVIVGNAIKRGNPAMEYVLNHRIPYISGPQWLSDNILNTKKVIAISGTHGKTTTTSMMVWILKQLNLKPSYLIGGVVKQLTHSAYIDDGEWFIIEADEYDTSFFDKRSKFIHYRPDILAINNIEFDHGDIFNDISDIKKQFHHLIRTIPEKGHILYWQDDAVSNDVLDIGCWSECQQLSDTNKNSPWFIEACEHTQNTVNVYMSQKLEGTFRWNILGQHNRRNALTAIACAHTIGIPVEASCEALMSFPGVKRRLECIAEIDNVSIFDDFAHHPTAIRESLTALREHVGNQRIISVLEPTSNSMQMGIHKDKIIPATKASDITIILKTSNNSLPEDVNKNKARYIICNSVEQIIEALLNIIKPRDNVLIMSNKNFENLIQRLLPKLAKKDKK